MELSKQQLGEIFDIVNAMYLGLKGEDKKAAKKASKLWKPDNNLHKFMIALYNKSDIDDAIDKKIYEECNDYFSGMPNDWETKKVSFRTHHGRIAQLQTELDEIEEELDNIQEGKGYISESQHNSLMMEQLKEQQEIIRLQGDTIAKLRNLEEGLRSSIDSQSKRYEDQKKYYEQQIQTLV
tara:strand:+ start:141 stop:683 length:543 start_codon:yes stop_codon:yes gene_type:complete